MIGPGAILDRYELLRPLAAGGMGEVHLARIHGAAGFGSLVAIKLLISNLSTNPAFVTMFLDEARNVAKLRHKNIVQIRDIAQHANQYYMVMEYIPGQNLRELLGDVSIPDNPLFSPKLGADIFSDLASALAAVHHAGLVHRDLSPNNIMIGDEGVAKLIDFGVARALGTASLTNPGTLKGKFSYMAPEYIRSQAYDHRVDIFSLGVVMWETFMRRRLFRGTNMADQLHQVLEAPIPRLDEAIEGFPHELAEVVASMLERDPARRAGSAGELADRMRDIARDVPEGSERMLRKWLERRVGDRIEARRRDDQEIMTTGPNTAVDAPLVSIEPSSTTGAPRAATPVPQVSGFHAVGPSMSSGTSIRLSSGQSARDPISQVGDPAARKRTIIAGAAVAVAVISVFAMVALRGGDSTAPHAVSSGAAAAPTVPAPPPANNADVELHRRAGMDAMRVKDYGKAISEFAEAIRLGGASSELIQMMELARKLQRDPATPQAPRRSTTPMAGYVGDAGVRNP